MSRLLVEYQGGAASRLLVRGRTYEIKGIKRVNGVMTYHIYLPEYECEVIEPASVFGTMEFEPDEVA